MTAIVEIGAVAIPFTVIRGSGSAVVALTLLRGAAVHRQFTVTPTAGSGTAATRRSA